MNRPSAIFLATALSVAAITQPAAAATPSASEQLKQLDKSVWSGGLQLMVTPYGPVSPKTGKRTAGKPIPATVLFERPDRFKLVLDPGGKTERRIVGDGDIVYWLDVATGVQGKSLASELADPTVLALLGTVSELGRLAPPRDIALGKQSLVTGARMTPRSYAPQAQAVTAWLHAGQPAGFAFDMADQSRLFVAVLWFKPNLAFKPSDFSL